MSETKSGVDEARSGPPPIAERRLEVLPQGPGAVTVGRDFTRQALIDWHWLSPTPDRSRQTVAADVLIIVSELLSNASLHGGGPRELVLATYAGADGEAGTLRLTVTDGNPAPPTPRTAADPGLPGGHGLHMVELLADRWGADAHQDGKAVWAEVSLTRLRADQPG